MTPALPDLFATLDATWPPARRWTEGPFTLREGQGGGQRVSAATAEGPVTEADIDAAEAAMRGAGQRSIFMLRGDTPDLDAMLEKRGYPVNDRTIVYAIPIQTLTDRPVPRVTAFSIWEPLAIMDEIWDTDGVGPERRAIMARVETKTAILSRWNEKPGGVAFAGLHGDICMVHAVVVLAHQRRQGIAGWMMRQAAFWAQAQGARWLSVLCVADNEPANGLYRAMGFTEVGRYHYRRAPD